MAKSGTSYVGIVGYLYSYLYYLNSREYISVKLKDSLKKDVYYCGSFNVCLAEMSRAVIKELGMCLTKEPITNTCSPLAPADTIMFQIFFKLKPQVQSQIIISDSIHWTEIKNAFKAEGGEKYLTLGCFVADQNLTYTLFAPTYNAYGYYYIDDVSLVEIIPPKAGQSPTMEVCPGSILQLGNDSVSDATYEWFPAQGLSCTLCPRPIITATSDAMYVLTKKQCNLVLKDTVFIKIHPQGLAANAGNDALLCLNDGVKLGPVAPNAFQSYTWQPTHGLSCFNCPHPFAAPIQSTSYTLTLEECGIITQDEVLVEVEPCELLLPQAITLNSDGKNDALLVKIPFAQNGELRIFNRWGNEVYYTQHGRTDKNHLYFEWDGTHRGKPLPSGVYFYMVEGTNIKGEPFNYRQYLHLIR